MNAADPKEHTMGKASELDESIRPLSPAEIRAENEAREIADADVRALPDGRLVKEPTPTSRQVREVQPSRRYTWD